MPSLIWTPRALADLDRLHRFPAERDKNAARRAIRAVREGMRVIEPHPEAGRAVDGMEPTFRDRRIAFGSGGYLVLHGHHGPRTVILAVRHGRELGYGDVTPHS